MRQCQIYVYVNEHEEHEQLISSKKMEHTNTIERFKLAQSLPTALGPETELSLRRLEPTASTLSLPQNSLWWQLGGRYTTREKGLK